MPEQGRLTFRYVQIRGLTGIAAGVPREMRGGVSQFSKSEPMGPKGAFRDNVAHSCQHGMKNYPNWGKWIDGYCDNIYVRNGRSTHWRED